MSSKVEPHSSDEGKFQATFDTYGHGSGNGKSRAAVYKHWNKVKENPEITTSENKATASLSHDTKSDEVDFVQNDDTKSVEYGSIAWLDEPEDGDPSPTIPAPIRRIATGDGVGMSAAQLATQSQLIRWGYMGLDRGLTHWGRGVMNKPSWTIERNPMDYDALEGATMNLMESHGISIQLSPSLVWGTVVAAAYVPPLAHVARHADPTTSAKLGLWLRTVLIRPSQWFRRGDRRREALDPQPVD